MTLTSLVERAAAASPDRVALSSWADGAWREVSYAVLEREMRALGSRLIELGVARGSRVVILSESRPEWAVAFFAILYAGGTAVPLDPRIEPEELQRIVEHCSPQLLLVSPALPEGAWPAPVLILGATSSASRETASRNEVDDVALLAYTSGTTGTPKGVLITTASLLYEAESLVELHGLREDDVFLSVLPLHHLLELTCGLIAVLCAGGEVLYARTLLPADLADQMQMRRVTSMVAVPALYRSLEKAIRSNYPRRISHMVARFLPPSLRRLLFFDLHRLAGGHVRRFISGGSPLDRGTLAFFGRLGVPVWQGYGLTETAPVITVNAPGATRPGSVGRRLRGTELRIADDGEILVRGPQLMRGYYKEPELTRAAIDAAGWFHTGDLGRIEDGFLYITGRIKDLIVPADGRKIHPDEVESVLSRSPKVKEVCVIGVPSERGEEVCAVVVPADGFAEQEVEADLRQLARSLRDFKRPKRIIMRHTELPRTRSMKVRRSEVQKWVTER